MNRRSVITVFTALIAVFALAGCGTKERPPEPAASSPTSTPSTALVKDKDPKAPDIDDSLDDSPDYAALISERDQFLRDQQQPTDGSMLRAVTSAQKDFMAAQHDYVDSVGGEWTAEAEGIYLSLAFDACETSILNSHSVDQSTAQQHIRTSPLFDVLIPADTSSADRGTFEAKIAETMVYGTSYICPNDYPQWSAAIKKLYPGS